MDVRGYNREAWDKQVEGGNQWTIPVGPEVIEAARRGEWNVLLTDHQEEVIARLVGKTTP